MEIRIIIPEDCDIETALLHTHACFNPSQNDWKKTEDGYNNGYRITFRNDRTAYFYKTKQAYILKLYPMEGA